MRPQPRVSARRQLRHLASLQPFLTVLHTRRRMRPAWRLLHQPFRTIRWYCRSFLGTTLQLSYCAPLTKLYLHALISYYAWTVFIGRQKIASWHPLLDGPGP